MKNEQTRIMIVDDDPAYSEGISILLKSKDYFCQAVNDSKIAFEELERMNYEILIIDWMLQQFIQTNIRESSKINQSVEDRGTVLLEMQELLKKYQPIENPTTIPTPLDKRMIDPESRN